MKFKRAKLLLLVSILLMLWPSILLAQDSAPKIRFIVTQVIDHTANDGWKNHLIAYGIRNLVNNELYDTGKYIPVEDRPEITAQIDNLIAANWGNHADSQVASQAAEMVETVADCQVIVTVRDFKVKRRRSIGLFAAAKTTIKISVDIELHCNSGVVQKVSGSGDGVTKSMGILFQIREDKVHFNETTVGQATQKAIHHAINKL